MIILLLAIGGYIVSGYCWLFYCNPFVVFLFLVIDDYFIGGYWCLFY
jgi:hypothetical protein